MDRTDPDPTKILAAWMEWERGEAAPGRALSNLKIAGLREVLESLAAEGAPVPERPDRAGDTVPERPDRAGDTVPERPDRAGDTVRQREDEHG